MSIPITNAALIQFTTPATPDARGGRTPGSTTDYPANSPACVDRPRQSQLIALANKVSGIEAVMYIPLISDGGETLPVPRVGSRIKYQQDGDTVTSTVEVLHVIKWSHEDQSHFETYVKNV